MNTTVISGLRISGIGLASALGGARRGCAAAHAGLSRPAELDIGTPDFAIIGHPVAGRTDGFAGVGRYWRLCSQAIDDLLETTSRDDAAWDATAGSDAALFVHVRDNYYDLVASSDDANNPVSQLLKDAPAGLLDVVARREENAKRLLLPRIGQRLGISPSRHNLTIGGPAAFISTLSHAARMIAQSDVKRCIVAAVDSLLDVATLEVLRELNLLKSDENPVGLAPGECSAFLVLEGRDSRRGPSLATLEGMAYVDTGLHRFSGQGYDGRGLADAMRQAMQTHGESGPAGLGMAIGNLNGDLAPSQDFGRALVNLQGWRLPASFRFDVPAACFGDTGAAVAPLSICMAVRAFARDRLQQDHILVWVGSDDGGRGSCLVSRTSKTGSVA